MTSVKLCRMQGRQEREKDGARENTKENKVTETEEKKKGI